jgi:predicted DNA-binding protein
MPKPASQKKTRPITTWVTESTAQRVESAAQRLGWSPCQLVRQAVEAHLPDVERAANILEQRR